MEKKPVRSEEERIRLRPSKRLCPSLRPSGVLQPSTEARLPPCAHLMGQARVQLDTLHAGFFHIPGVAAGSRSH